MSHAINFAHYSDKEDVERIIADIRWRVSHQGDRCGTKIIRFPTNVIFNDEDSAMEYIQENDRGNYDGIAVKFRDFSSIEDTSKIREIRKKISETIQKKEEYIKAHSVKTRKAAYVNCPCCGSKLNKDRLYGNVCPLCHTDLRSATVLDRIKSFDVKLQDYEQKIKAERSKQKDKAKIQWLVKYEYHC